MCFRKSAAIRNIASAALSFLMASTVTGQDKPDFSGRWVLWGSARGDIDVPLALVVRQPITRTNASGAPMEPFFSALAVEREFSTHSQTETYQIGVEGGIVTRSVRTTHSVRWEGNRLVIATRGYSGSSRDPGPSTEHIEEWELDATGTLVILVTNRNSGAGVSKENTFTYRRN